MTSGRFDSQQYGRARRAREKSPREYSGKKHTPLLRLFDRALIFTARGNQSLWQLALAIHKFVSSTRCSAPGRQLTSGTITVESVAHKGHQPTQKLAVRVCVWLLYAKCIARGATLNSRASAWIQTLARFARSSNPRRRSRLSLRLTLERAASARQILLPSHRAISSQSFCKIKCTRYVFHPDSCFSFTYQLRF